MRCKGFFFDDRTCDLCKQVDSGLHLECQEIKERARARKRQVNQCPHRKHTYGRDDYDGYYACTLTERDPWGDQSGCGSDVSKLVCVLEKRSETND